MKENNFFNRQGLNLDISHRCPLACLRCQRQTHHAAKNEPVPGEDLSIENFKKLTDFYKKISFCGQLSDPIHHPQFIDFLKICNNKEITVTVHTASSFKSMDWYIEAWNAYPEAKWLFGIDGLPKDSNKYRINQDGVKLFEVMKKSCQYLKNKPFWQYIMFSYNENDIQKAKRMADDIGVIFLLKNSGRWDSKDDWLLPKAKK